MRTTQPECRSSIGIWSFGKEFARNEALYRKGYQGLAYEIVINSNPCLVYIMEENSAMMQTLVIAHAGYGHSHFFKNNYVFKQWTDADGILDYLEFARGLIAKYEDRYGQEEVERVLDAAHALQSHGIHRFPRKRMADLRSEQRREEERRRHGEQLFNDLWRTVPQGKRKPNADEDARRKALLGLPEENLLMATTVAHGVGSYRATVACRFTAAPHTGGMATAVAHGVGSLTRQRARSV